MPVKRRKGEAAKADKLFSLAIRSQGYCEASGYGDRMCSNQLQPAHINSRRYNATRCDTRNAFCLCFSHHRYFHDFPREFSKFITDTWAQQYYDYIYQRARSSAEGRKVDWNERIEFLTKIVNGQMTIQQAREREEL